MHRPVVILGLFALLVCAGSASSASGGRAADGTTFAADADAYVTAAAPKRNFGKARTLRAAKRPSTKSYVHFTLAGIDAPVSSATLRLYVRASLKGIAVRSTAGEWSERSITFKNAPRAGGVVARAKRVRARRWVSINVTRAVKGKSAVSFALTGAGTIASREAGSKRPQLIVKATPPTLLAAGDVAFCGQPYDEATAALIKKIPGTVAALGDLAYEHGTSAEFAACYQPSWGAFKGRTRPAIGNHEYEADPSAAGYFGYWGARAGSPGQAWYSYDLGGWHVISLNSNCSFVGGCFVGSPQEAWLRADLAAHPKGCTLAYWHHPRFSGGQVTNELDLQPIWQDLYDANADLVLSGHAHNYQRFAPQNAAGAADPARGIREFVVGTGGNPTLHPVAAIANTEVMNNDTWGVLKLTLRNSGYDWQFLRAAGGIFTDSGSQACH
jgi:calcineurin-like phosphoesterase family protein